MVCSFVCLEFSFVSQMVLDPVLGDADFESHLFSRYGGFRPDAGKNFFLGSFLGSRLT